MAVNASAKRCRVVSSMRLIASFVWAIESTRSLRWRRQERVACLELVELLDGHHVDRARADRSSPAARRWPLLRSSPRCSASLTAGSTAAPHPRAAILVPHPRIVGATRRARPASRRPAAPSRSTSSTHVVEGRLHGFEARLRQMRQFAFRRRAGHIQLAHGRADRRRALPRLLQDVLELDGPLSQRQHGLVCAVDLVLQRVEGTHVGIQMRLAFGDGGSQALQALAHLLDIGGQRRARASSSAAASSQPRDVGRKRRRTFDQRGMRGAGLGGLAIEVFGGLARFDDPTLRHREAFVRQLLIAFQPADRFACLNLPASALLVRPPPGAAHGPAARPSAERVRLIPCALQLRLISDNRLLEPVLFGAQGRHRVRRLRDRRFESRRLFCQAGQRIAVVATRSRSSLISRLVSRMPRASSRAPPVTTCGPRNTSPAKSRWAGT